MKGWKEIKVSDIGRVVTGNTPPRKSPQLYGSHTIFIKPTDVSEGSKYTYAPEECYSGLGFKKYKNSLIPKGATCVVTIGSIGKKMTKAHCNCFINQAMNAVIPNEFYDEEFVYYVLKYNLGQLKALDSGTASGRENVSKSSFSSIRLFVPQKIETQQKIGLVLSAYDDLMENNFKRIKLLEELAQRTYEEWFVNFKVKGNTLKVDEGTGLPQGWAKISVGEFIQFQKGKKVNLVVENYQQGLEKVLLLDGIESGVYPYTDPNGHAIAERGDLLMLMDGARSSKVFFADRGVVGSTMARVVINNRLLSPTLLRNFFDYNFDLMRTNNTGAAIPHANKGFINSMIFPMPPEEVLKLWNDNAEPIYRLLETLKEQNRYLKEARDILLPRLMDGTINVEKLDSSESMRLAAEPKVGYQTKLKKV